MKTGPVKIRNSANLLITVKYKITRNGLSIWCGTFEDYNPHWVSFSKLSRVNKQLILKQLWLGWTFEQEVG